MPEFCCVRCFACSTFQVQQVKKVPKFQCARCHQKQTVQQMFAVSALAKDVRLVVQQLNLAQGEQQEKLQEQLLDNLQNPQHQPGRRGEGGQKQHAAMPKPQVAWENYTEQDVAPDDGTDASQELQFTTVAPDKKRATGHSSQGGARKQQRSAHKHTEEAYHVAQPFSEKHHKMQHHPSAATYAKCGTRTKLWPQQEALVQSTTLPFTKENQMQVNSLLPHHQPLLAAASGISNSHPHAQLQPSTSSPCRLATVASNERKFTLSNNVQFHNSTPTYHNISADPTLSAAEHKAMQSCMRQQYVGQTTLAGDQSMLPQHHQPLHATPQHNYGKPTAAPPHFPALPIHPGPGINKLTESRAAHRQAQLQAHHEHQAQQKGATSKWGNFVETDCWDKDEGDVGDGFVTAL